MELTTEQKDIAKAAREFAEKEFRDRAKEFDEIIRRNEIINFIFDSIITEIVYL